MQIDPPTRDFITVVEDSRRWAGIPFRDDDIIVSTPPKTGTTWTQAMISSLLWPAGDAPDIVSAMSLWVDTRMRPIDEVEAILGAQTHRRFIKTHTPRNAIPTSRSLHYVTVYRNPADALVSWGNHRAKMRAPIMEAFNELAAVDGLAPLPAQFDGDYDTLFEEWATYCSPAVHLADWWPHRHDSNVTMSHYSDIYADLEGHIRALATFLGIDVPAELWPAVVDRCRIDAMRDHANALGHADRGFEGGAASFFYRGGNGRGQEELTEAQLARVRQHCADVLPSAALEWLEHGGELP